MPDQIVSPGRISIIAENKVEKKHARRKAQINQIKSNLSGKNIEGLVNSDLKELVAMICLKLELVDENNKLL